MDNWQEEATCVRCGAPLCVEEYQSTYCENCQAMLDMEIEAEEAEIKAEIDDLPDESPGGGSDSARASTDLTPSIDSKSGVPRQQSYTREDHDWNMNHDRWGRNPRDRDP